MKSYDEFRQTVFEKAEAFQARRKARNKKILEVTSLCSLALVITLSSYFGIFPSLYENTENETSFSDTTSNDSLTTVTTETTTTSTTVSTTTTTIESTTASTEENLPPEKPLRLHLEFRATAKNHDFAVGETEITEIENMEEWLRFLEDHLDDYPSLEQNDLLSDAPDEEYFEKNILVIIQYAGYDIVAFSSNPCVPSSDEISDQKFFVNLRKNDANHYKQIHIMSVSKENYTGTEIKIWENN